MKYRRLTKEELVELEKEFVEFLVVNGIVADDWGKLKQNEPDKAEQIIEQFSDVIFEGTLRKIQFVDIVSKSKLYTFQCLPDKIILRGLEAKEGSNLDFLDDGKVQELLANSSADIQLVKSEKNYHPNREEELFGMLQRGALISDGKWFKAICLMV